VHDSEFEFARKEFHDMQQQLNLEKAVGKDSYLDLLTERSMLKRVAAGFLTMFGAQCTGTLVINSMQKSRSTWNHVGSLTLIIGRLWHCPLF
jgi:hypothetical protein